MSPLNHLENRYDRQRNWQEFDETMADLCLRVQAGDNEALEQVIAVSMWIIRREVSRFPQLDNDDATQEAMLSVMYAAKMFQGGKKRWQTFSGQLIRRDLARSVQRLNVGTGVSRRVAEANAKINRLRASSPDAISHDDAVAALGISAGVAARTTLVSSVEPLQEYHTDTIASDDDVFEKVAARRSLDTLQEIMSHLTPVESSILMMIKGDERTISSVAQELNLTYSFTNNTYRRACGIVARYAASMPSPF